jgi:hypothetical protein
VEDSLKLHLKKFVSIAKYNKNLELKDVIYSAEDKVMKIKIFISRVAGNDERVTYLTGNIFVKYK